MAQEIYRPRHIAGDEVCETRPIRIHNFAAFFSHRLMEINPFGIKRKYLIDIHFVLSVLYHLLFDGREDCSDFPIGHDHANTDTIVRSRHNRSVWRIGIRGQLGYKLPRVLDFLRAPRLREPCLPHASLLQLVLVARHVSDSHTILVGFHDIVINAMIKDAALGWLEVKDVNIRYRVERESEHNADLLMFNSEKALKAYRAKGKAK